MKYYSGRELCSSGIRKRYIDAFHHEVDTVGKEDLCRNNKQWKERAGIKRKARLPALRRGNSSAKKCTTFVVGNMGPVQQNKRLR